MNPPLLFTNNRSIRRRDTVQIIADVLTTCREPQKLTAIIRRANLQYRMLLRLMKTLQHIGFLEVSGDGKKKRYTATTRGIDWSESIIRVYEPLGFEWTAKRWIT